MCYAPSTLRTWAPNTYQIAIADTTLKRGGNFTSCGLHLHQRHRGADDGADVVEQQLDQREGIVSRRPLGFRRDLRFLDELRDGVERPLAGCGVVRLQGFERGLNRVVQPATLDRAQAFEVGAAKAGKIYGALRNLRHGVLHSAISGRRLYNTLPYVYGGTHLRNKTTHQTENER